MLQVVADLFNTEDRTRGFLNRAEAVDRGVQPTEMVSNNRSGGGPELRARRLFAEDNSPRNGGNG
jgi:hypothetical protein